MPRYSVTLRRLGLTAVGALAAPAMMQAQMTSSANRAPDKDAKLIMVTSFKSSERGDRSVGAQAADALRSKISSDFPFKQVYVIPKERINPQLEASGFSTTEGLALHDQKALATMLRADEYISGNATRTPNSVKLDADLVLTTDVTLRQPLGTVEAPNMGGAVSALSKELKEALKQLDGQQKCSNAAREKKYPEAIAAARAGIAAYPKATLARICLATVLDVSGAPADSILAVTKEITAIDPKSNPALTLQAKAYDNLKQTDSTVSTLVRLLATDMTNARLQATVIEKIAASTNPRIARPIVDTAVALNPGDPDLLKLRWLILGAVGDYKEMIAQGEELVKLDTAFSDSTYFARTASAYVSDSQPQKAAEAAARGVAKFPTNSFFVGFEIQQLQRAGQQQQALEKLDKAIAAKVPVENAGALRLNLLRDLKRNAEILPFIRTQIAAGDTTTALRQNLFAQLADDAKAGMAAATTPADSLLAQRNALAGLLYADSVITAGPQHAEAQFRVGAEQLKLGNMLYSASGKVAAQKAQSCPLAKEAKDHMTEAQILLPKGGSYDAKLTTQLMGYVMQLSPAIDTLIGQVCK